MQKITANEIEAVFFDVGNTLLKPYPSMEAICRHVIEQFGYTVTDDELRKGIIAADRFYAVSYWSDDTFWATEDDTSAMWVDMFAVLLEETGICLLYTSDAADDLLCVDLGGRRI